MPFFGESKNLPFMYKKGSLLYIRRVPFYIVEGRSFDSQNLRLLEAKTYAVFQAGAGQAQGQRQEYPKTAAPARVKVDRRAIF
jgi:hypothetical protein